MYAATAITTQPQPRQITYRVLSIKYSVALLNQLSLSLFPQFRYRFTCLGSLFLLLLLLLLTDDTEGVGDDVEGAVERTS